MKLTLHIWRQKNAGQPGHMAVYSVTASEHMSFLEMLDMLNERLIAEKQRPVEFDHDCREGICGSCGVVINGVAHGPQRGTATCQLHMRHFKDGDTIYIEPWRAAAFPVIKDLVVDRSAFDRIIEAGGFISAHTGGASDANLILVPKPVAEMNPKAKIGFIAFGTSDFATLAPYTHLAPGESTTITFVLAWYFPVRENYWHRKDQEVRGRKLNNYYGTRFKSAWDVAVHTASRLPELEQKTRVFTDTFFASTLPPEVLEAVSSQMSILRTNTCILLEGKSFFGFEGCADDEANGWMNCSHVWNYTHALAFLFPELERSVRDTDFLHEMRKDDSMATAIESDSFNPAGEGFDQTPVAAVISPDRVVNEVQHPVGEVIPDKERLPVRGIRVGGIWLG